MNNFTLNTETKIKTGFTVPENYFEDFSEKFLKKLPQEKPKTISIWETNKRKIYSIAAVLVLSLSIPVFNYFNSNSLEKKNIEIENYLTSSTNLSDEDFAELLDNEAINNLKIESKISNSELENNLSANSELEHYITTEN